MKYKWLTAVAALALWCAGTVYAQNPSAQSSMQVGVANPIVAGPVVQSVTDKSAQIWFETSDPSLKLIVRYGTGPNNEGEILNVPSGSNTHAVSLTDLSPNITYWFDVVNAANNQQLAHMNFNTQTASKAQQQFQITHGPEIESLGPDSIVVAWTTNVPSSSVVRYGTDAMTLPQQAQAAWGETTHRVTINNLKPFTRYYFSVESGEAQGTGQAARSAVFSALTLQPGQSPMAFNTR